MLTDSFRRLLNGFWGLREMGEIIFSELVLLDDCFRMLGSWFGCLLLEISEESLSLFIKNIWLILNY
jgi:hypothetical protein